MEGGKGGGGLCLKSQSLKSNKRDRQSVCAQTHILYRVSQKNPKTIENDLLLEFQCLALN